MAILDMAIDMNVVKRKGSWLAYKGETLGQGKDAVAQYIEQHPELMEEISGEVLAHSSETLSIGVTDSDIESPIESEEDIVSTLALDEGVLELDTIDEESADEEEDSAVE